MLTKYSHEMTQPFYLSVAKQEVNDHSTVFKFGAVPAMSQNASGTVWDVDDTVYPWASWATPTTVTIPVVNAADNDKFLELEGLDANYNVVREQLQVSSSTATTSVKTFSRLYRAAVSGGSNVGDVNVTVGGTTVLRVTAGKSQTLMSIYTVPAGYTGYVLQTAASCQAGADATIDLFFRFFVQSNFRIGHTFELSGNGGAYEHEFLIPGPLPEKTDIDVRAAVRTNNARISCTLDILLVKNPVVY